MITIAHPEHSSGVLKTRKDGDIVYPIICQWELSVAMETSVLPYYQSMGAFSCHENQCFDPICPNT